MKALIAIAALLAPISVSAEELPDSVCDSAFVCEVVNYQRMYLDGSMRELQFSEPFGFKLKGRELVPQQGETPLGDGTLSYGGLSSRSCDSSGRLAKSNFHPGYQFEASNGLRDIEYKDGQMLIAAHVHHEFFEVAAANCREL